MEHSMILSASGWRKIFAASGNENDTTTDIGNNNTILIVLACQVFVEYLRKKTGKQHPVIACGTDTRPTGPAIADAAIRTLISEEAVVRYTGIAAAPEIMAYSRVLDGFIYISASHNPVGHNGLKFGDNDGGVLKAEENAVLIADFEKKCAACDRLNQGQPVYSEDMLSRVYAEQETIKRQALCSYDSFLRTVITGTDCPYLQEQTFATLKEKIGKQKIGVVCDMNGSARTKSLDAEIFKECSLNYYPINNIPGQIVHGIIPEPENLVWCAKHLEKLQNEGHTDAVLGYMPDCDGDRGNIVYWNDRKHCAEVLEAQEVFALSVLSTLAYGKWLHGTDQKIKQAVAVNGPTSMRTEYIAEAFGAHVFRSEVGEANVINLAREKRKEGYEVRILGEGSNGGTIVHPEAVRDPVNTVFLLLELLTIRDSKNGDGTVRQGLFHLWCEASGQKILYKENFTLTDIIGSLPSYTTTGVSEQRAVLHIRTSDHGKLKARFQKQFEQFWLEKKYLLTEKYGFHSYKAFATKGTKTFSDITDYSISGKGGLKIIFYSKKNEPLAFMWMRGSGTEPVFRIMCDVKGNKPEEEAALLQWETQMLETSDE